MIKEPILNEKVFNLLLVLLVIINLFLILKLFSIITYKELNISNYRILQKEVIERQLISILSYSFENESEKFYGSR